MAALHRPTLSVALASVGFVLAVTVWWRHRLPAQGMLLNAATAIIPILLVCFPWLFTHREGLYSYYFEYGPAIGGAESISAAIGFNFHQLGQAIGPLSGTILAAGFISVAIKRGIDWTLLLATLTIGLIPMLLLVASKSWGNAYVQQMSLGLPALLMIAIRPSGEDCRDRNRIWDWGGMVVLVIVVISLGPRLGSHLQPERLGARGEVESLIHQIVEQIPDGRIAGFHDLPVSIDSLANVAVDLKAPLRRGNV